MCGKALPFRETRLNSLGYAHQLGRSPKDQNWLAGRPKAFRTSSGEAAPLYYAGMNVRDLVSDRDSLKACFAFRILPGDIEHVRMGAAVDDLKPFQLIPIGAHRFTIDQRGVRHDRSLCWKHALERLKTNVNLGRTDGGRLIVFEKHGQNLDMFKCVLGCVGEFQKDIRTVIQDFVGKGSRFVVSHILFSFRSRRSLLSSGFESKERQNRSLNYMLGDVLAVLVMEYSTATHFDTGVAEHCGSIVVVDLISGV